MNHTKFDGVLLSPDQEMDLGEDTTDCKICLDNLPIDVTEEEIRDAIGFCGEIKEVEIYNLRPELDPGSDLADTTRVKPKKKGYWSTAKAVEIQRETPVYAFVTFKDKESMNLAYTDNLRIFGLVMRKQCSSIARVKELDTLYIDIPGNAEDEDADADEGEDQYESEGEEEPKMLNPEHSLEVEMRLRDVMGTSVFICMALGEHEWGLPSTVEIRFPNHEIARWAKNKIENSEECQQAEYRVNWFRTRPDAMKHWRREVIL